MSMAPHLIMDMSRISRSTWEKLRSVILPCVHSSNTIAHARMAFRRQLHDACLLWKLVQAGRAGGAHNRRCAENAAWTGAAAAAATCASWLC